jgi:hypothetical protein
MKFFQKSSSYPSPVFVGFLQAVGVLVYIAIVATFLSSGFMEHGPFVGGSVLLGVMLMLTLLSVSALICGAIAAFHPLRLVVEKQYVQAATVIAWMAGWMILILSVIVAIIGSGTPGGFIG